MRMLDGKVVLVAAAGGGLGQTHALLAAQGAALVVNHPSGSRASAGAAMADGVVEAMRAASGKAVADYGSASNEEQAEGMVPAAVENFGQLDTCICNAGIPRNKNERRWHTRMTPRRLGTWKKPARPRSPARNPGRPSTPCATAEASGWKPRNPSTATRLIAALEADRHRMRQRPLPLSTSRGLGRFAGSGKQRRGSRWIPAALPRGKPIVPQRMLFRPPAGRHRTLAMRNCHLPSQAGCAARAGLGSPSAENTAAARRTSTPPPSSPSSPSACRKTSGIHRETRKSSAATERR